MLQVSVKNPNLLVSVWSKKSVNVAEDDKGYLKAPVSQATTPEIKAVLD